MHRLSRVALAALVFACASGFDWPGRVARDVSALTAAETPREFRDALRLLRERALPLDPALLEGALSHTDPAVRSDALAALTHTSVPHALLQRALRDEATDVRVAGVELARKSSETSLPLLLESLSDREARVRSAGLRALAQLPDAPGVLPALSGALRDPALDVRVAAVRALADRAEPAALAALLRAFEGALPELEVALLEALAPHARGRAAIEFELALADEDEQVVLAALRGYALAGDFPRELVTGLATAPSPAIARAAELLLARSSAVTNAQPPWLAPLEQSGRRDLDDAQSAHVLARLERTLPAGEVLASDALIDWLLRAPLALRVRIAALAERSHAPVRASLVAPLLSAAEPALRTVLLQLLARAEGAAALPAVRGALHDADARVRDGAARALRSTLDEQSARLFAAALERARGERRMRIVGVLAGGLPRLATRARSLPSTLAHEVCDALEEDIAREPRLAATAVRALGALRAPCGRKLVRSALNDRPVGVRIAALRASVLDRGAEARAARAFALRDGDASVVASAIAARALADDGPPARLSNEQLASQVWPIGPAHAFASALATPDPERTLCPLLDNKEPLTRSNALAGLALRPEIGCAAPHALSWLSGSSNWPAQQAAATWLNARLRHRAEPTLREALARCARAGPTDAVRNICSGRANTSRQPDLALAPRALVLTDGRVLVSIPDGAGDVSWPNVAVIGDAPAWLDAYAKE